MVENTTYEVRLIQVLDRRDQVLRSNVIPFVKILWQYLGVDEATWVLEALICERYPEFLD